MNVQTIMFILLMRKILFFLLTSRYFHNPEHTGINIFWRLSILMKLFTFIFSTCAFWNIHGFELQVAGVPPNNLFSHQIIILKTRKTSFLFKYWLLVWMSNIVNSQDLSSQMPTKLYSGFKFILSIWFHLLDIYHLYMFEKRGYLFFLRQKKHLKNHY